MKLNELKSTEGSRKDKYRAARGMAQGRGKQAGRGQSGQNKRGGVRPGFEGGQNPWFRRMPKIGFNNVNAVTYQVLSLDQLNDKFKDGDRISFDELKTNGLISKNNVPIKLLANGKISKKLTIVVQAASKAAVALVEKAGGKVEIQ